MTHPSFANVDELIAYQKEHITDHAIGSMTSPSSPSASPRKNLASSIAARSIHDTHASPRRVLRGLVPNDHACMVEQRSSHIFCGQFSQSGRVFYSAVRDCTINVFNTTDIEAAVARRSMTEYPQPIREIRARDVGWSIIDVALSPDEQFLLYSSWCPYLHLCHVTSDSEEHFPLDLAPQSSNFCAFSVQFSQTSNEVMAGGSDHCIYMFDLTAQRRTVCFEAHDDDINAVEYADSSSQIVYSGSDDGTVKVWDRRAFPHFAGVLLGHTAGITSIHSRGDGRYLISSGKDQSIKLWDVRAMKTRSALSSDDFAASTMDGFDYRWSAPLRSTESRRVHPSDCSIMTYRGGHHVLRTLIRAYFSPAASTGQRYIVTGSAEGHVAIYDVLTGELVQKLTLHSHIVRDVAWHPYLPLLLSSSWDGFVAAWEYRDPETVKEHKVGLAEMRLQSQMGGRGRRTERELLEALGADVLSDD
jgi:WD repeat-containing protein 23